MKHQLTVERCSDPSIKPKCPSCRNPIEKLLSIRTKSGFFAATRSDVVVCPRCHTMLGYGKVYYG